jgi:gamma-glutamyltranspeptidase/glutathione hydrolase
VACEHPAAAVAGLRVLDEGGTAADACVAMAAAMAVAPMATGMGGDAFLLFYEAETGRVLGANGSGAAPRSATIQKLRDAGLKEMPARGGTTITVPGAVRLWEDAANSLGNLPFARLLEPAWELAENGFPVSEVFARYWEVAEDLLRENGAAAQALLVEGRAPRPGEVFSRRTLRTHSRPSRRAGPSSGATRPSRRAPDLEGVRGLLRQTISPDRASGRAAERRSARTPPTSVP